MRYRRAYITGGTYFFTLVTDRRRAIFQSSLSVQMFEAAISMVQARHPFAVEAQVILPDHLHALWSLPDGDADFSTRWRLVKSAFTRSYLPEVGAIARSASRQAKGEQSIWQRRFWEHLIRDEADFAAHLDYIHFNPVRHGLVAPPRDWPYSSFAQWVTRGVYERDWGSDSVPKLPDRAGME